MANAIRLDTARRPSCHVAPHPMDDDSLVHWPIAAIMSGAGVTIGDPQ